MDRRRYVHSKRDVDVLTTPMNSCGPDLMHLEYIYSVYPRMGLMRERYVFPADDDRIQQRLAFSINLYV